MPKSAIALFILAALVFHQCARKPSESSLGIRPDSIATPFDTKNPAQQLSRADFQVGPLRIGMTFDSVLAFLGTYKRTKGTWGDTNYVGFYFPKLTAWLNKMDNRLIGLELLDSSSVTWRGLRVGDSTDRILFLYGKPRWVGTDFDFVGPYDYPVRGYSEARLYLLQDFHLAVLAKAKRIVRILMFRETRLDTEDYNAGVLQLGAPFESVASNFGRPDSLKEFEEDAGFTGYYFGKLVLWRNDEDSTLSAFDIYDSSFTTARGLRIGDSVSRLQELYGNCRSRRRPFSRVGPYDSHFTDYHEAIVLGGNNYLILFAKDQRIVKILSYVGVQE